MVSVGAEVVVAVAALVEVAAADVCRITAAVVSEEVDASLQLTNTITASGAAAAKRRRVRMLMRESSMPTWVVAGDLTNRFAEQ